jgi:hypothetical protein
MDAEFDEYRDALERRRIEIEDQLKGSCPITAEDYCRLEYQNLPHTGVAVVQVRPATRGYIGLERVMQVLWVDRYLTAVRDGYFRHTIAFWDDAENRIEVQDWHIGTFYVFPETEG